MPSVVQMSWCMGCGDGCGMKQQFAENGNKNSLKFSNQRQIFPLLTEFSFSCFFLFRLILIFLLCPLVCSSYFIFFFFFVLHNSQLQIFITFTGATKEKKLLILPKVKSINDSKTSQWCTEKFKNKINLNANPTTTLMEKIRLRWSIFDLDAVSRNGWVKNALDCKRERKKYTMFTHEWSERNWLYDYTLKKPAIQSEWGNNNTQTRSTAQ